MRIFPDQKGIIHDLFYEIHEDARILLSPFEGHKLLAPIHVSYALPKSRQWIEVA
jgi:hypothetical protein